MAFEAAWIAAGAAIVGSLVSLGGVIYQSAISRKRAKELEAFKADLSQKNATQLEQLRAGLMQDNAVVLETMKGKLAQKNAIQLEQFKAHLTQENAEQLEAYRAALTQQNDARKARRDYEYEARKRLYTDLYPLTFRLNQLAAAARRRIANLALAARDGHLVGPDGWLTHPNTYYFNNVIYSILAPLGIIELMTRKLTLLDLALDSKIRLQYLFGQCAIEALRSDFNIAPGIKFGGVRQIYSPPETAPISMSVVDERWQWRQGVYSGQIALALKPILLENEGTTRVATYAEFAQMVGKADLRDPRSGDQTIVGIRDTLGPMIELFREFHPARRPVTWRILLAQAVCFRAISICAESEDAIDERSIIAKAALDDQTFADFTWAGSSGMPPDLEKLVDFNEEENTAREAANDFLDKTIRTLR